MTLTPEMRTKVIQETLKDLTKVLDSAKAGDFVIFKIQGDSEGFLRSRVNGAESNQQFVGTPPPRDHHDILARLQSLEEGFQAFLFNKFSNSSTTSDDAAQSGNMLKEKGGLSFMDDMGEELPPIIETPSTPADSLCDTATTSPQGAPEAQTSPQNDGLCRNLAGCRGGLLNSSEEGSPMVDTFPLSQQAPRRATRSTTRASIRAAVCSRGNVSDESSDVSDGNDDGSSGEGSVEDTFPLSQPAVPKHY